MDVVALGELLIDFTPAGTSKYGNPLFERNAGGAPANVLAALSKFGASAGFIGKVGNDRFGLFLKDVLVQNKIDTSGLLVDDDVATTLAFVHLDKNGDRSFTFCRKPGADVMLRADELDYRLIDGGRVFHFGSLSMSGQPARDATFAAVKHAKASGKLISYDPNFRPPLWPDAETARKWMSEGIRYADVLKLSETELLLLSGRSDPETGTGVLSDMGIGFVAVTLGPRGCYYRRGNLAGYLPTYDTPVTDTTGAGDAFWGAVLYRITREGFRLDAAGRDEIEDILDFANASGALCAAGRGAISAIPTLKAIADCRKNIPRLVCT